MLAYGFYLIISLFTVIKSVLKYRRVLVQKNRIIMDKTIVRPPAATKDSIIFALHALPIWQKLQSNNIYLSEKSNENNRP